MFELKKRKRADSCDAHGCRIKEGLTVIEFEPRLCDNPFKLCEKHRVEIYDAWDEGFAPLDDTAPPEVLDDKSAALVKLDGMLEQAQSELTQLAAIEITGQSGFDACGAMLKQVKGRTKEVEALRVEEKKPYLMASKEIDGRFKPAREALLALEKKLKDAMAGYKDDQEQRRVQLLAQGSHEEAIAQEPVVMPAGIQMLTTWQFEVTDEDEIPREFMVPDAAKIQAHVSAHKNNSSIAGIRVYPSTGVRSAAS